MDVTEAILESWDRQCRILDNVASLVTEENRKALPSPDGWPLDHQLAHIHLVRKEWATQVAPEIGAALPSSFVDGWKTPISDLTEIKSLLKASDLAVREAFNSAMSFGGEPIGGYDHPILFLQHMVWHEGWHIGLIFLGLRLAGHEPSDQWEETNVWGHWRTEEFS